MSSLSFGAGISLTEKMISRRGSTITAEKWKYRSISEYLEPQLEIKPLHMNDISVYLPSFKIEMFW